MAERGAFGANMDERGTVGAHAAVFIVALPTTAYASCAGC